jgi:hypothetical protein
MMLRRAYSELPRETVRKVPAVKSVVFSIYLLSVAKWGFFDQLCQKGTSLLKNTTSQPRVEGKVHQRADELVASLFGPAAQQLDLLPDVGMLGPTSAPSPPLPRCYGDRRMPHPTVYGQP